MPWSKFIKWAFPGSSRAVFGRRDPDRVPSIFSTPRGPRVTFNSNLKVTRALARNIPQFKPVICPAGARRGPCRDPPWTRGQILKKNTQDTRPGPYDVRAGPGLDPCRDPCIISRGDTLLLRDVFINVQLINPSINQSINLVCNLNQIASQNVYK